MSAGEICQLLLFQTQMNILKYFLGDTSPQNQSASLASLLAQLESTDALPQNYYSLYIGQHQTQDSKISNFEAIVKNIHQVSSPQAVIKNLTVILKVLEVNCYQDGLIQKLEQMESPQFDNKSELNQQWLRELYVCCKSYLMRLASLSEVMQRSAKHTELDREKLSFRVMLSDLYLILNTVALLFPYCTSAINTIGRYYIKTNKYFHQFYQLLREALLKTYKYMKFIVDGFITDHSHCQINQLQCFMQTLPQIELMCDKIEQFLMNKYFRGKAPASKLYLKEQEIEEISYYLKQKQAMLKDSDSTESAEQQEQFGEFA